MIGISISFGSALAVIISHPKVLGGQGRWPIAISLVAIPSLIYLTASTRFPETTYYLIRNGHKSEAVLVLQRMRDGQVESEMEKIEAEINIASTQLGIRQIYRTQQYRNQLYAVCALLANLMFTGTNCFILYMDLVFIDAGIPKDSVTYATIGIFSLQIVTTCVLSRLMLRFGGRKLSILANSCVIFSLVLFTVSQATRHLQSAAVMSYFAIVAVALHLTCTNGLNIAHFAIISEITIEPTRATCVSAGNVILWISSWLVGFLAPYLQEYLKAYSVTPWLGCTILFLIYIVIFIPDTKGKSTDEIQAKFRRKQIFRSKQPPSSLSSVC
ncbi:solute carrier family 2, facilitated glucose transporter member 7-like [Clavelina lepadiformis]|uniref:solute carrier family 2, facilitated glucose transporter member 7-like n=1 Tax=Clavelina lepadiformis TaxID=159417 RepID=UPI004041EDE1